MTLIWALLVIVVLGVTAAIAVGRGGSLGANYPDRPDVLLPTERPLTPEDVEDLELSVTLRGYRMDEVDEVLRRLRSELAERDERIALLGPPRHRAPEDEAPADGASENGTAVGGAGRTPSHSAPTDPTTRDPALRDPAQASRQPQTQTPPPTPPPTSAHAPHTPHTHRGGAFPAEPGARPAPGVGAHAPNSERTDRR